MNRFFICMSLMLISTNVWAADEDTSYSNYDSIVNELKTSIDDRPAPPPIGEDFDWQEVALHGGLAFATSFVHVNAPNGAVGTGMLKGVEFNFGMNLFTRTMRAEGAFSSYASEELDNNLKADLKEFELRVVYLPALQDNTTLRFGLGLAARYMNLDSRAGGVWQNYQGSTPSSLFLVGFERKISANVTLGPDLSYRSAIVSDTFDKSAWDASFRLNATF
ncbi:MAG: hypothetical protein ACXVA9_12695 [Bdellovibrionales bacterium]